MSFDRKAYFKLMTHSCLVVFFTWGLRTNILTTLGYPTLKLPGKSPLYVNAVHQDSTSRDAN